ncbi:MAG: quercetin 2,3-dioxygenase [Actinomycetota bacterium]|nr:quercetin 2,3-dioxygenase [Actinomycetota bacterium]
MDDPVLEVAPLGFQWATIDPFLFCVHHVDAYPAGNEALGPDASLAGREMGSDFAGVDGWRMYHGETVPGFPQHPHRGFETVTFVRRGLIDHSDSLGATARFGRGDVQWLTAGKGIVHCEMFPLIEREQPNPLELFQIWLNLPAEDKMVDPYFTMLWDEDLPRRVVTDEQGRTTSITVIAGELAGLRPPPPPPDSWASRPEADLAIWHLAMDPGARVTLPPAAGPDTVRVLYLFEGSAHIGEHDLQSATGARLRGDAEVTATAGPRGAEALVLQGRPIGEPVAQYGPFVMNDQAGVEQAFSDYRATGFGGWPWPVDDPVHERDARRFARDPQGRLITPTESVAH